MKRLVVHEAHVAPERLDEAWSTVRDGWSHAERVVDDAVRFYDTFDWRLWSEGVTLDESVDDGQRLLRLVSRVGAVLHRQPLDEDAPPPAFASALPAGSLRQWLEGVIAPRRLLPLVELRTRIATLHILDVEEKTVARVDRIESFATAPDAASTGAALDAPAEAVPLRPRIRLRPVRGYDDDFAALRRSLGELRLDAPRRGLFDEAVAAVGRVPGDDPTKVRLDLDPAEPAADAARRIHRHLLAVIDANEDGTRRDLDSEFLHDFRVAVRRTRSALSQIQGVFAPDHLEHFKTEWRWLGGVTGPTRDLDVYLLKMPDYRAALPDGVRADLEPLEAHLVERQRVEQAALADALASPRYRELIADWRRFLDHPPPVTATSAPHAERPIRELASERIWKSFRKVVRRGGAIDDSSPDEALHDLRIDCKKLRYLLEFFRALYPAQEIDPAIKSLKRLQTVLGDFNDYSVQQESMRHLAEELAGGDGAAPASTLLAMGRLVAHLEAGQRAERERFAERFAAFAAAPTQRRFRALFR